MRNKRKSPVNVLNETKDKIKRVKKKYDIRRGKKLNSYMAVEVTDEKIKDEIAVEQALIAEHVFRKTIENSIPAGIAGFDLDGCQIYVNRAFCEMVGWREDELIGNKFPYKYWPFSKEMPAQVNYTSIIDESIPAKGIEVPFKRKNGKIFWCLVFNTPLTDSKGKTNGRLISAVDISVRKKLEETLRTISSKLINVQETERKLLSQDLHDSIGGKLTGIKYGLEKFLNDDKKDFEEIKTSILGVIEVVQRTILETQRITKNLHPSVLEDLGIHAALRDLIHEYQSLFSHIHIEIKVDIQENQVPEDLKILIYRVFQEAFNNIIKHSGADTVQVELTKDNRHIVLKIQDNGKGFDLSKVTLINGTSFGMGLNSMRERTELFNGSLKIRSAPGKGASIEAKWPYS